MSERIVERPDRATGQREVWERPGATITQCTFDCPGSDYHGRSHYRVDCGGMQSSMIGVENVLAHFAMMMQEVHRLRWIISRVDEKVGGTVVYEVSEMTQPDWERIEIKQSDEIRECEIGPDGQVQRVLPHSG